MLPTNLASVGTIALRCPRRRISGRHRCAAERGADGAARRPHQVQGFNARSFVSGNLSWGRGEVRTSVWFRKRAGAAVG